MINRKKNAGEREISSRESGKTRKEFGKSSKESGKSSKRSIESRRKNGKSARKNEESSRASDRSRLHEIFGIIRKNELTKGITPRKLRSTLEDLGPAFIKLGQILSSRSDVLPAEYCRELENLRSDVEPMPYGTMIQVVEDSYGRPWREIFESIEKEPLGSASIAQVHRAQLLTGEDVIIKVQRPGIYDLMKRDIGLLRRVIRFVPNISIKKSLNIDTVLNELWVVAQEEMNFLQEASNMEEFERLNTGIKYISTPKLFRAYSTGRVLCMEYIDGLKIDDKAGLEAEGYDLREIGTKLVDHYIKQVMDDGFFHADPHGGNIVVRDGKIVWIDMGMMGRFSNEEKDLIGDAVEGIAKNDTGQVEDAVMRLGEFYGKPDKTKLYQDIEEILDKYAGTELADIDIAKFLQRIMEVMKDNQMKIPHGFTLLARGIGQLEGVLLSIAPDLSILEIASNHIKADYLNEDVLKKKLKENFIRAGEGLGDLTSLPSLVVRLLKDYQKGQTHIRIDLHSSDELSALLHHLVRSLVIGMCEAALLVSASIICTTDMWPKVMGIPAIGAIGYLAAILVAAYFCIRRIVRKKMHRGDK